MDDSVAFFFEEVWLHRRNRFIGVGGAALFLLFIALALQPIPWIPIELKQTMIFLAMAGVVATMLLIVYYALKFIFIAFAWLFKKAFRISKQEQAGDMDQGKLDQ
jgi:apolipoprotein N-acyltransferase